MTKRTLFFVFAFFAFFGSWAGATTVTCSDPDEKLSLSISSTGGEAYKIQITLPKSDLLVDGVTHNGGGFFTLQATISAQVTAHSHCTVQPDPRLFDCFDEKMDATLTDLDDGTIQQLNTGVDLSFTSPAVGGSSTEGAEETGVIAISGSEIVLLNGPDSDGSRSIIFSMGANSNNEPACVVVAP